MVNKSAAIVQWRQKLKFKKGYSFPSLPPSVLDLVLKSKQVSLFPNPSWSYVLAQPKSQSESHCESEPLSGSHAILRGALQNIFKDTPAEIITGCVLLTLILDVFWKQEMLSIVNIGLSDSSWTTPALELSI